MEVRPETVRGRGGVLGYHNNGEIRGGVVFGWAPRTRNGY
jgi:hypothetical protein